ncbi:hypothetical protein V3C99_015121 [Haemonchus contortus]
MPGAEFIRVTARVRPSASSRAQERITNVLDDKNLCFDPRNPRNFTFDAVFSETVTQEQVFERVAGRIIDGCVNGFNGTIFAYGQTGSGKTHTMLGPSQIENFLLSPEHRGLIPRACDALFTKLCTKAAEKGDNFKYEVVCRFVELYNEEFYDLLSNSQQKLSIRSDSNVVQLLGVTEHSVQSGVDLMRILEVGWDARRTAETAMNRESSRSHAIFIIDVKTEELVNTIVNKKCATLNLVDLAGSERQSHAKTVGERFKEAININLSLSVLGRVIRTLSAVHRRDEFVPYRDSKLTHILRDSLGGNSKTAVIVNLHPDIEYYSDTLSALQFAAACRKIENRVHANEDLSGDTVMAYKSEISRLRAELDTKEEKVRSEMAVKVTSLEEELKLWKDAAISREKQLVEAQLQRDLFAARLTSQSSGEGDVKSQDEIMNEIASQLLAKIDSAKTFQELSRVQLENDLSSVQRELDQMRLQYESAEAARKALSEKYSSALEGYDAAVSPLRRLNLNTSRIVGSACKTPAQLKKERRMTMFTPPRNQPNRKSRAFKPVLFDDSDEDEMPEQPNMEQDPDMVEERELLRLEMENNRLTQLVSEKEAKINETYEAQKIQAQQWVEERMQFLETESSLKSEIERLESEKSQIAENLEQAHQRIDMLSSKISTFNDERCCMQQEIDKMRAEKFDLEDLLQGVQNEQEHLLTELRSMRDAESSKADLEARLSEEQVRRISLKDLLEVKTKEANEATALLQQTGQAYRAVVLENDELKRTLELERERNSKRENDLIEEFSEVKRRIAEDLQNAEKMLEQERHAHEEMKRSFNQVQERNAKMEREFADEVNKLKRRHVDELKNSERLVELERSAHEHTKQQFSTYRDSMQQSMGQKLAELQESFVSKERRLTTDMSDKDQQIIQLQGDKELLCSRLSEKEKLLELSNKNLEKSEKELEVMRAAKAEGDRAIKELAGHHNQKQKISYLEKVRLENYNLKNQCAQLEAELKNYRNMSGKRTRGSHESLPGPSTRSRSARGNPS